MKNLHVAALATLFGISAASGIALTQAQHPSNVTGLLASTAAIAAADPDDRGKGRNRKHRPNNINNGGYYNNIPGQNCNTNTRRGEGDNDRDDQGNNGANHGRKNGWNNPNNPHYGCGGYNNNPNCQYNGQYNGQYGQNNNCNPNGNNGGQYGGNASVRGTIVSINGSQLTLMEGFGQTITINDQPALNNQQTGRISIGRYVTAYGYYQNGQFYATSLQ